jgi:hypothetical protein
MYLSLPLPVKTERTFTLTFFYQDSRRKLYFSPSLSSNVLFADASVCTCLLFSLLFHHRSLTITIPKLLRVSAVKEKIAEQAGVAADYIILCGASQLFLPSRHLPSVIAITRYLVMPIAPLIILAEIHDHKFYRIFQDQENLSQMRDNELLAAYVQNTSPSPPETQ